MKTQLSSLDISFLVKELASLVGTRIDKVYQIGGRDLRIDIRAEEKKQLIVTPRYLCLSKFEHEAPEKPSNLAMILRKKLSGGIIKSVEQHRFDRIVEITIKDTGKLILEFFSRGNVILVDEFSNIVALLESQEWRDRTLKPGLEYKYPPETPDIKEMQLSDFAVKLSENKEAVRILASDLGLGATYANEVLERAQVDPTSRADKSAAEKIYKVLKEMLDERIKACMVSDITPIDVTPFKLRIYETNEQSKRESFNGAVDEYFTNLRSEGEKTEATKDYRGEIERINTVLKKQKATISEFEKETGEFKQKGDAIYADFGEIDALLKGIEAAKLKGKNWTEFLREKGLRVTKPAERKFEFKEIEICVDKSVPDNATMYYEKSKKAKSKLEGALEALKETERELAEVTEEKARAEKKLQGGPVERHKPEWYEKFRWFVSSDGFLVIGGRDAATNEILIKKHTEKNDLVFHSTVYGAPFFVVKNPENKVIAENTKLETAQAAASYSSAWGEEMGSADIYAVKPKQVSKTPESGEYLSRGAFVIRGEREWFRGVALRLAMGFRVTDYAIAIGGPEGAVKSQTKHYTVIGPGSMKSGELAAEIKANILRRSNKEDGQKIKRVILGEIQKWIPAGKGMLAK